MHLVIPSELEQLIQQQIDSGRYHSALEVISAGLQLLNQQDDIYQGRLQELQQAVQIGYDAAQHGELVEGSAAMAQIRENLRTRHDSSN